MEQIILHIIIIVEKDGLVEEDMQSNSFLC